jgi:hypothetical protein
MYKLHLAEKELNGDIPCYEFKKFNTMLDFILEQCFDEESEPEDNVVYLLSYSHTDNRGNEVSIDDPIIVDRCIGYIISQLEMLKLCHFELVDDKYNKYYNTYYLQKYGSYEEAYKVALSMKETSELCYENKQLEQ